MADLKSKVEDALNETRILLLGGQVLIGSALRLYFMDIFAQTPSIIQAELTAVLGLMLVALGLLLLPAAYHQVVDHGEDTADLHLRATLVMDWTLFIFAIGLGSYTAMAAFQVLGAKWAIFLGTLSFFVSIFFLYLVPWRAKRNDRRQEHHKLRREEQNRSAQPMTGLDEKIKTALIECRMVLPGAQALLGFQLVTFLEPGFAPLPQAEKLMHVFSLLAVGISTVLLMSPAAFHRIAEAGENTDRMYRFSARMLLWAMFFLGVGIAADFAMVLYTVTDSYAIAGAISGALLAFYFALWFGYTYAKRGAPKSKLAMQPR